ncbi:PRA1 family protein F2-like [Malania oleifera]|uniref:PRA1 family protein F2-like n=1 Tax=Malania oleifera TaxID=397392 RepID=UPI0025AEB565|nr:PRA1 family protein F2-like [Malania oleifera]
MTNYGTISTSPPGDLNREYVSRAKERLRSGLATRRPWRELLAFRSFGRPASFNDAVSRARTNAVYFRANYAIFVLTVLFLSLLWHPISLIVFIVMMAAWLFLYFLRDEPLMLFRHIVDDRVVLIALSILTIVFLLLTHATVNIVVALLVGAAVAVLHAAFRKTDDLFLDEEAAEADAGAALFAGVASTSATGTGGGVNPSSSSSS